MSEGIAGLLPPMPGEGRESLIWRRDFLNRVIPEFENRRLRTFDGPSDTTEETVHSLRLRLGLIEAELARLD